MLMAYLGFFSCKCLPCIFVACQIFFLESLDARLVCYGLSWVFTFLLLRLCVELAVSFFPLLFLMFSLRASALRFFV